MSFTNRKWWPLAWGAPSKEKLERMDAGSDAPYIDALEDQLRHTNRLLSRHYELERVLREKLSKAERRLNNAENSLDLADEFIEETMLGRGGSNPLGESEAERAYTEDVKRRLPTTRRAKGGAL